MQENILIVGENDESRMLGEALSGLDYPYLRCSIDDAQKYLQCLNNAPEIAFVEKSHIDNSGLNELLQKKGIQYITFSIDVDCERENTDSITYPFSKFDVKLKIEQAKLKKIYEEKLKRQQETINDIMTNLTKTNVKNLLLSDAMKKINRDETLVVKQGGFIRLIKDFLACLMEVSDYEQAYFFRVEKNGDCKRCWSAEEEIIRFKSQSANVLFDFCEESLRSILNENEDERKSEISSLIIEDVEYRVIIHPIFSRAIIYGVILLLKPKSLSISVTELSENTDSVGFLAMEFEQALERHLLSKEINVKNKALKETNDRLRFVLSSSSVVLFSLDLQKNKLNFISGNVEKILGYNSGYFISNMDYFWNLLHPDDVTKALTQFKEIYKKEICVREYRLRCANGRYKWIHEEMRTVKNASNSTEVVGYFVDISEQVEAKNSMIKSNIDLKAAYKDLEKAKDQLLQSEKMASIGQLAAGVAHEINNPVGYISSNLSSLSRYVKDLFSIIDCYEKLVDKDQPDYLNMEKIQQVRTDLDLDFIRNDLPDLVEQSQDGVKRVKKIIQDLKDFSHVDESEWAYADIHQGLESTLNIVNNEIKYKAEVIKQYGEIPKVECIITQLDQVFMNILVNAAHAIEERGTITIVTECVDDQVRIKFIDTGKGIEKKYIKRLFDPFFTTKPVGKGTGLGLSLSYGIIERHHGSIQVKSEVGKGTCFTITIPISQTVDQVKEAV